MLPENATRGTTMRQKLCALALVAALAAGLGFGLPWRNASQSRAEFLEYARLVDQCRSQPDADLRLTCFDHTIAEQPEHG
jgi:hypothetical protein